MLKKMKVTNDHLCTFCKAERDTIEHIFWHCEIVQRFWKDFVKLLHENVLFTRMHNMQLSECLVILGIEDNRRVDSIFYFILLLGKQYLYQCKMNYDEPMIAAFRRRLSFRYNIEEYNARLNCTYPEFSAKWSSYKQLCTVNP